MADGAELKRSVQSLIIDLFGRLEVTHGVCVVRATLSYLTLSRGIGEGELNNLLSLEDNVLADVYEWWVPPLRTSPPLVLSRLLTDISPYLSRRGDGSGVELLSWYHRQFWEACEAYCFNVRTTFTRRKRYRELVEYYSGKWAGRAKPYNTWLAAVVQRPSSFPGETAGDRMVPAQPLVLQGSLRDGTSSCIINLRRVRNLVVYAIHGGEEARAVEELTSVEYMTAMFASGMGSRLLTEVVDATNAFPASGAVLRELHQFLGRHMRALRYPTTPGLAAQLVVQEPDASRLLTRFRASEDARPSEERWPVLEWAQRPQENLTPKP
ncbi:hypothetical protein T484DRAFT_1822731 [Baffinella frigidus]|nr:hypothetical protein T484DRAFT_1822731 [Cryptophyta sp. CCMP2293]